MLLSARGEFYSWRLHKLPHSGTCSAAPWEIRSHSFTPVLAADPWRNLLVCYISFELLSLHCLNSPGLLAVCLLVFPTALPDPVAFPLLQSPKKM